MKTGGEGYDADFYKWMHPETEGAARSILGLLRGVLPRMDSVVDVGCGLGTWLNVATEQGTANVLGIDGEWIDHDDLRIPSEDFLTQDLRREIQLDRRFDLAISCEVAEHLPEESAAIFVESLCGLSDFILFSAAIPGQGGTNHINEQWPSYWIELFEQRNYVCIDFIRKRIWVERGIPAYYRQNILLFARETRIADLQLKLGIVDTLPPEKYLLSFSRLENPGIRHSLRALAMSIGRFLRRKLS